MALENNEVEMAICHLEKLVGDAKERAGIADLGELDTEVAAHRALFDADPATVVIADLAATKDKVTALRIDSITSASSLWSEIDTEAAA